MAEIKFALVSFIESNSVGIVESKDIETDRDRTTLNCDDWDSSVEVHVLWKVTGRSGSKKKEPHVAKILRFDGTRSSLVPFERAASNGDDIPMKGDLEYGRGKRKADKKASSDDNSSGEDDDVPLVLRKKQAITTASRIVADESRNLLKNMISSKPDDIAELQKTVPAKQDTISERQTKVVAKPDKITELREKVVAKPDNIAELQKEVSTLRQENSNLRNAMALLQDLPKLLEKVQQLTDTVAAASSQVKTHVKSTPLAVPQQRATSDLQDATPKRTSFSLTPQPTTSVQARPLIRAPSGAMPKSVFDYDVDDDGKVDLGHGVYASAANLQYVSRSDCTKTTYTLCEVLFTRDELRSSSLTGKRSNAFQGLAVKEKLDENKVRAILDFVTKMHGTGDEDLKKKIASKLNIAQKSKEIQPKKDIAEDFDCV